MTGTGEETDVKTAMKTTIMRASGMITVSFPDGRTGQARTPQHAQRLHRIWAARKGVGEGIGVTNVVLEWHGFGLSEVPGGWKGVRGVAPRLRTAPGTPGPGDGPVSPAGALEAA